MNPDYFLWVGEEAKGPFTIGQLRGMWSTGQITSETLYAPSGAEGWTPLSDIIKDLEPPRKAIPVPNVVHQIQSNTPREEPVKENGASKFLALLLFLITAILAGAGFMNFQPSIQEDALQKSIDDTTPALQTVDEAIKYGESTGIDVSHLKDSQSAAQDKLSEWKTELANLQASQTNTVTLCFIGAGFCFLLAVICVATTQPKQ